MHFLKKKFINNRSNKLKLNITVSLIIKFLSMVISFFLVSIVISYLGKYKYGVWISISALANWFVFFDFGLGNGLKNKLSESIAKNNYLIYGKYIGSTYFSIAAIFTILFILFFIVSQFLNWYSIFNITKDSINNLDFLVVVILGLFFLRFIVQLIGQIIQAIQLPSINDIVSFIGQALVLLLFLIISKQQDASLFKASIIYVGTPIIVLIIFTVLFFYYKPIYRPSFKNIDIKLAKNVIFLGNGFMLIQLSSVLYKIAIPILITYFLSPNLTTEYSISLKYFSIMDILSSIFITPFWAAITEAFTKKDYNWIKRMFYKTQILSIAFGLLTVVMIFFSTIFFGFWVPNVDVSWKIVLLTSFYSITFIITRPITIFINGLGKIKQQVYFSIIIIIFIIPINLILFKWCNLGVASFLIPPILFKIIRSVFGYFQIRQLIISK